MSIVNPSQNEHVIFKNKGDILILSAILNSVQLFTPSMMDKM